MGNKAKHGCLFTLNEVERKPNIPLSAAGCLTLTGWSWMGAIVYERTVLSA